MITDELCDDKSETEPPNTCIVHTPDIIGNLDYPWSGMAGATLRHDDAKKREHAALIAGDVNARERAIFDQFEALADRQKLRDNLSQLIIGGLRIALEDNPAALSFVLAEALEQTQLIASIRSDIRECADIVVELRFRRRAA